MDGVTQNLISSRPQGFVFIVPMLESLRELSRVRYMAIKGPASIHGWPDEYYFDVENWAPYTRHDRSEERGFKKLKYYHNLEILFLPKPYTWGHAKNEVNSLSKYNRFILIDSIGEKA